MLSGDAGWQVRLYLKEDLNPESSGFFMDTASPDVNKEVGSAVLGEGLLPLFGDCTSFSLGDETPGQYRYALDSTGTAQNIPVLSRAYRYCPRVLSSRL